MSVVVVELEGLVSGYSPQQQTLWNVIEVGRSHGAQINGVKQQTVIGLSSITMAPGSTQPTLTELKENHQVEDVAIFCLPSRRGP
ncbi:hypothetical protein AAFF_G00382690 [Aldrovandia affinis]|uniref:Uncharacterized protein n=1 Tax=Aldrovandia affinis TaxID=143900 RepID=A0AAD7X0Q9_9TELE|nr:hypothetical protein AAFF_G00382690 [Aldrovandia affinis]